VAKVLVVDDVPDNVKLLSYELSDHGFEVLTAFDGPQALEIARSQLPDVILLDIMMPGLDGIEVCRQLKADTDTRPIPVIMISARDLEEDVVRGLDVGACDYVTKPFNLTIVLARVRTAARAKADHDLIAGMNERLAELALTDGLTGLRNHRSFREAVATTVSLASREHLPLSLIMLDVDHFKSYNDNFGHPAGDEVLRALASILHAQVRKHDLIARYGGEEFAVLLPGADEADARGTAERLRWAIESHAWPRRAVTASLGIATLGPGSAGPLELIERADEALYRSKRSGRNRLTHHRDPVNAAFAAHAAGERAG
jgi:diguanylate cyclase (GGDEF)-like protein